MPGPPDALPAAEVLADAHDELRAWRTAHPQATFYDIEVATERQLARVRAALVRELVSEPVPGPAPAGRPRCPACGVTMQQVGQQERTVRLAHDEPVAVRGPRYRCPGCGAGLFPPG